MTLTEQISNASLLYNDVVLLKEQSKRTTVCEYGTMSGYCQVLQLEHHQYWSQPVPCGCGNW